MEHGKIKKLRNSNMGSASEKCASRVVLFDC